MLNFITRDLSQNGSPTTPQHSTSKTIVGATTLVDVFTYQNIPAKIDTGADTSAIWASDIVVTGDQLSFKLFAPVSPFYTGETFTVSDFKTVYIRSSNGIREPRYRAELPLTIHGKTFHTLFTLADRSKNQYPILIGKRALHDAFIVDVSLHQ